MPEPVLSLHSEEECFTSSMLFSDWLGICFAAQNLAHLQKPADANDQ